MIASLLWLLTTVLYGCVLATMLADVIGRPRWMQCRCGYHGPQIRHLRTGGTVMFAVGYAGFSVSELTHLDGRVSLLFGVGAAVAAALFAVSAVRHHSSNRAKTPTGDPA